MSIQPGEPVYFLSLELQNVGAFGPEGVTLDLSDGQGKPAKWTLILGENGIGKTTALECLLALTPQPGGMKLNDEPNLHGFGFMLFRRAHPVEPVGTYLEVSVSAGIIPVKDHGQGDDHVEIKLKARYSEEQFLSVDLDTYGPFDSPNEWPGKQIYSYDAARDVLLEKARYPEQSRRGRIVDPATLLRVDEPISVDSWLLDLHHSALARTDANSKDDYLTIQGLLIDVLPGVEDIRSTTPRGRQDSVEMEYLTDDGWVSYPNLGLGYKSVMGLIGDLAYRLYTAYPESSNPLHEAAVVLIDEIDLHLHPTWQRKLIGTLSERFPNVQFIATAHSPLMVQAAAGHNLVLLRRDPQTKQVVAVNDVDGIANWRLDQIVTSELFGAPSAVRPQLDPEIGRRDAILAKTELTDEDRDEVRRIEAQLGDVPLGTTDEDRRANALLRRTLEALEKKAAG